ncbi:MAG: hypothetical protein K2N95_13955 [Lachnospiraceae bacterium]|nr:hypothetical protein [Lachnospiraceae bacterium]
MERKNILITVLFLFSFLSVFWVVSVENSFSFDDVAWLQIVSTSSYGELFSFFPHSTYLDRPVGVMFLKLLYETFRLDYSRHHTVLVIIHLANVFLAFLMGKSILRRKWKNEEENTRGGVIAAGFFGIWSRSHMAIWWDAAIFDLLGTMWSFLSVFFYFRYRNNVKYKRTNLLFLLLFYYLAIRTKEMFLILPVLFALFETWEMFLEKKRKSFTIGTKMSTVVLALFLGMLFYFKFSENGGVTNDINSVYYQSFHPVKLVQSLLKYCMLCFDLQNGGWIYYAVSVSGLIGTIVLGGGCIISIVIAVIRKNVDFLLCYLAIGVSISTVLPMINRAHVLYLYFPAIFVGLLFAVVVVKLNLHDIILVIILGLFLLTAQASGNVRTREDWLANAKYEKRAWDDIGKIAAPMPGTTIYIKDLGDKEYTPFFYGDGAVCKLLYDDASLKIQILRDNDWNEIAYSEPYIVWEYCDGQIKEIERNNNSVLMIEEIYQYAQEDGSLLLGIVPNRISDPMKIYVNEFRTKAVIGETFISAQIPAEIIEGKEAVALRLEDAWGLGEEYVMAIENR